MPGVVVRYAKGKGFLMDEHLAKITPEILRKLVEGLR